MLFFFFAEKCSSNLWSTYDVWCGGTQRHARDAAARMSGCVPLRHVNCHVVFFFFSQLMPKRLRLGLIRTKSGWLEPYRPKQLIQAEIQKKKRCETHRLSQILNPTFSSLHTNTPNKLSASLSLRHSSLTLFVLSTSCWLSCWLSFILF